MEDKDNAGERAPEQVLALITLVESSGWPTTEAEQDNYFQMLGLRQLPGAPQKGASPAVVGGVITDSASTTPVGSWMTHEGELVGISLFLQQEPRSPATPPFDLFDSIHSLIRAKFGEPLDDSVQPAGNASALWKVNGTGIELYRHVNPPIAVQVGLNNLERTSAVERLAATGSL
ncbi:hypothetical protein ACP3TD_10250 [Pseudarthrobacter sp. 1G09]|uniref:hypothetical protein n=1 Tax=Pseudarthrobacter sp. 1G09 TaxID=3416178 RepID=UPI003CF1613B